MLTYFAADPSRPRSGDVVEWLVIRRRLFASRFPEDHSICDDPAVQQSFR